MTNVRRANLPDQTEVAATRLLRELKFGIDRDERKAKRKSQRQHREAWDILDAHCRDLVERCALCGAASVPYGGTTRVTAVDWAGAWARGHLNVGFCGACSKLWRYADPVEGGALALHGALGRFNMAHYYPFPVNSEMTTIRANNRRARHALSWAGAAHRARLGGLPDPGDPKLGFSHISHIDPDNIDFRPAEPEPVVPRRVAP